MGRIMEAAIEKQILSLEELSNDLIAANLDNVKTTKEYLIGNNFEQIVLSKLQNIRNILEKNDKNADMMLCDDDELDDEILGYKDLSSDDLLQLLQNVRNGVLALDNDEVFKQDDAAESGSLNTEVKKENSEHRATKQIKQENITIKSEPFASAVQPRKMVTMFLCPIEGCNFSTTKEGMYATAQRAGKAAQHLKIEHKIRAVDMRPG